MTRYDSDALAIPVHEDTKSSVHALSHAILFGRLTMLHLLLGGKG